MEFFDKLTKKASETYKGAAEITAKIAKEAKLKIKINDNKSKINNVYQEIGKKVYQKHVSSEDLCIKKDLEEECSKIDILCEEIEAYNSAILELSNEKACAECGEKMPIKSHYCPNCGKEQPEIKEEPAKEVEVIDDNQGGDSENESCKDCKDDTKEECNEENCDKNSKEDETKENEANTEK